MAKPKRWRITLLVTVEEIGPDAHETRPLVDAIETRPATWYPREGQRRRRTRKGERPDNERPDDG